ncbi:Serine/threonine-protein kinase PknB [Roseivivax jejudonensis]|uniref:Serine/threonine-protein kinase PknB n=2 Tax=Roseivivax jejudonensis TaxID=1529041 RepID=A0A1X7AD51_9RHOB|nr:Serine/threonine-protein kinase PknB [Roseivivax jejudonensis]
MTQCPSSPIRNERVSIADAEISIDGFTLMEVLGSGANGTVFRAKDTLLRRDVAIKIWNLNGLERSRDEISKIAQFQHPLIVSTYLFDYAGGVPYGVMELVEGMTGKKWLEKGPDLRARMRFWGRYSEALGILHRSGTVHGDPHLGNVLLSGSGCESMQTGSGTGFVFKLADTGTSVFWGNHDDFETREEKLIVETARKLFKPFGLGKVFKIPTNISYALAVSLIDRFVEYLWRVYECVDWDRRSENATFIAEHIIATPLFDIHAAVKQVEKSGVTDAGRLCRRVNANLVNGGILDLDQDEFRSDALVEFEAKKAALITSLKERTHPGFGVEHPGMSSFRFAHWY